ncbi:ABC transporter permease [Phycicoccus sp. CSK15P-2]|uniref:FtsX-like permease family protein n=1 Tax=Phycicoccus sp. CSK15P-2 TaxID=2807627 RepID=UPI00194EBCEB|nr:ABC transporter permease [Phycicoccus sp. CSK15P-2]MBM6406054.1 ABC transporter permease [Phycicoccus sp. CSK15P-2]
MTGLTLATLRTQARRYVGPGLAVLLGVAFVATTLTLSATLTASVRTAASGDLGAWAAVVSAAEGDGPETLPESALERVGDLPEVGDVSAERSGVLVHDAVSDVFLVTTAPADERQLPVESGRMPASTGEVAVSTDVATSLGLGVGDRFSTPRGGATVVGVVDTSEDPRATGLGTVVATADEVTALTGVEGWTELRADAADGVPDAAAVEAVRTALGSEATVRTGAEAADAAVQQMTGGRDVLTGFLLAFAAVALLVSAIVIANTFSVLLARRARETALLRAVGATRAQVLRSALLEAVVLGLGASLVGVGVGALAARGLAAASSASGLGIPLTTFTVPLSAVVVPTLVGVVVTMAAALVPVVRSARISPMAALRPDAAVTARSRAGRVRIGLGLLGVLGGGAILAAGATAGVLPLGVLGGAVSFVGVLLAGSVLVPAVARLVGSMPARAAGIPGEMALENTVRHPARAASTASALLVGVTLIVMMSVGAATGQRSVTGSLDDRFSVDVAVVATSGDLGPGVVRQMDDIDGVVASADLPGVRTDVGDVTDQQVVGIPSSAADVVRGDGLGGLAPGVLLAARESADAAGLTDGARTTLSVGGHDVPLTVRVSDDAPVSFAVTTEDLRTLAPDAGTRTVLLRLAPDADASGAVAQAKAVVAGTGAAVSGGAPMRAQLEEVVDTLLQVVTALLAVSVVIAVVGIGTSLSLSVIERTRELALVRALGLTRRQLRGMLAGEAVLLAVVATVVGSVLGTVYGLAGPMSLFGGSVPVVLDVPWDRLGLVALAAVVCGLAASVLPARRASRIAPAAALADD